jgi:hypothetical protein
VCAWFRRGDQTDSPNTLLTGMVNFFGAVQCTGI